jgi:hypothetical protein
VHLIKAYAPNDSYATVVGNTCGSIDMVPGDFVQSGAAGATRVTTVAAKAITLTANSGAAPNLHIAVVDSVSNDVLYVTDEITDQVVTAGGPANVPSYVYNVPQPV